MPKLFIQTYGCQMNVYDSAAITNVLRKSHQIEVTDNPEQADFLFVNTCAVRHKAEETFFSELGVWRALKKKRPHIIIGVGGCVASQEGPNILKRADYVDIIFGPQTLHRLPQMLDQVLDQKKPVIDIRFPEIEKFDHLPEPRAEGIKAFVSIMEGCSKYCSYCIVPYTRGEEISRPFNDVMIEVLKLAEQGVREITLLGQNVNDYQGKMRDGQIADLALLIHTIAEIDGILRIRYTTSHPLAFSDRLIDAYAEQPKLANQLHLPVQSGSDRILNLMKRGYTVDQYKTKIRALRKIRPDISLTSDFIIGFPNETEQDHEQTLQLIQDIQFDGAYSFIYSPRPGTPAASLKDTVSLDVKKSRLNDVQTLLKKQRQETSQSLLNTRQRILIEKFSDFNSDLDSDDILFTGRADNDRIVNIKVNIKNKNPLSLEKKRSTFIGLALPVKITAVQNNALYGEIIGDLI